MAHQLFTITQNAVICDGRGHALILKDAVGKWLLPGGRINVGEHWMPALIREVHEETGLTITSIDHIIDADTWYHENGDGFCILAYACSVEAPEPITLSNEHSEYRWVSINDLETIPFWHPSIPKRIRVVLTHQIT